MNGYINFILASVMKGLLYYNYRRCSYRSCAQFDTVVFETQVVISQFGWQKDIFMT